MLYKKKISGITQIVAPVGLALHDMFVKDQRRRIFVAKQRRLQVIADASTIPASDVIPKRLNIDVPLNSSP